MLIEAISAIVSIIAVLVQLFVSIIFAFATIAVIL